MQRTRQLFRYAAAIAVALVSLATSASAQTPFRDFTLNVAGIQSWGLFSDPMNVRRSFNVGPNARIIGLGWSFTQTARAPSLLSEMTVAIGNSFSSFIGLNGESQDTFSGTRSYTSGGVLDLLADGADFFALEDGVVEFEFFEAGGDTPNVADGTWDSGSITIRVVSAQVVPEPATVALMGTGLVMIGVIARRRRRA